MSSAVEQFASNLNFGAFSKAEELKKRIWFTLAALAIYRLGTYVPLPGIDPQAWEDIFNQKSGGLIDMFDMFAGGAFSRMSVFTLNIMPYISASIIMQLMTAMVPKMEAIKKEGETGRKKINQYTRYLTVLLSAVQAYGLAVWLESVQTSGGGFAALNPGLFFKASIIITIVGGTMFLVWLGEQITSRGVGNGISLIIFAGIVAELPRAIVETLEFGRQGALAPVLILGIFALVIAVITFIVFMERAQRRLIVQYPKRQVGNRMYGGDSSHIPLKLNTAGVIPPIFASSLLFLPLTLVGFMGGDGGETISTIEQHLQHGEPLYMLMYGALVAFFAFFYTAIVFNPKDTAENLRKYGGFVPGIRPGSNTAQYIDYVLTRITTIGAAYLVFICLLPEFVMAKYQLPFYFGGTSLLIVVTVTMDTVAQIHSHLIAHQYEGLIKKTRLRGRKG
ncbi:MAG: preprotein translocase subunit SecY [Pseudomonadota bacterium]